MRSYDNLFHHEQPGAFHQVLHKGLIYVTIGWCYNCWITIGLKNMCTWWQVDIVIFLYGIPDIQVLSSIDVHETQAHGIRRISHIPMPSFVQKRKL